MTIGHRTNAIFAEAISMALDLEIDILTKGRHRLVDNKLAKTFGGDAVVVRELRRLRDLNNAAEHHRLGVYHNALLYAVLPGCLAVINEAREDGALLSLCDGRYLVREIDVEAFFDAFFEDADFILPRDVVNALTAGDKSVIGLDASVFGVANELRPHPDELAARRESQGAVEPIVELTDAEEAELHRRHRTAPEAVQRDFAAMGVVYRRGEPFPYWPAWLAP